jgi:pimeloyl-ACP methyl ester carboxylesterase
VIRGAWITLGLSVLAYLVFSFSARGVDADVLRSQGGIEVRDEPELLAFLPPESAARAGVLFIPGGLVHPHAYAPLLRAVAESGHAAILVKLPALGGRHAPGEAGRRAAVMRALGVLEDAPGTHRWLVAGHSLGGAIAARVAHARPARLGALALIGTTHPRDFSLADLPQPVVKVYGTRDGIARYETMRAHADRLPAATKWVPIRGGNHSQFGYYGFQLGDRRAHIPRAAQQAQLLAALLAALPDTLRGGSP